MESVGDIGNWDTSSCTNFGYMFQYCYSFGAPSVGNWDTSNVITMRNMFEDCSIISIDVSSWDVASVTNMLGMFRGVTLTTECYDGILIGWAPQAVQSGVNFTAGDSQYTAGGDASLARDILESKGWTIIDGGDV